MTEGYGFGVYNVTEIEHCLIEMRDGIKLGARLWIPDTRNPTKNDNFSSPFATFDDSGCKTNSVIECDTDKVLEPLTKFPAILEYLPYYKDGYTAARDFNRHPWFASHGFVCCRVEMRGTGSSEGYYYGEYLPQEQKDCVDVINYITSQVWSNGHVGMYGKSWGGINGLQMAYVQPKGLKTCISLYSTDSRYTDDIHYQGGVVIGNGMLSWAAQMFLWGSRPPPPKYFTSKKAWTDAWLKRLEASGQSWLTSWLHHQHGDDAYWKHGSIDVDYSKVNIPMLIIGGLEDSYKTAAYRMSRRLNKESRVIIGPWCHDWPDVSRCGPRIDYLKICLAWFTHHLTSDTAEISETPTSWPRLQIYVRDSFQPETVGTNEDLGNFIKFQDFEIDGVAESLLQEYNYEDCIQHERIGAVYFHADVSNHTYLLTTTNTPHDKLATITLMNHALQGIESGVWCRFGDDAGLPGNQRDAMSHSTCFYTETMNESLVMIGSSTLFVGLSSLTWERVYIHAKVCDIDPEGNATLVTQCQFDLQNKSYSYSIEESSRVNICRVYPLSMNISSHRFNQGHKIAISVSPTAFPMMWPSCSPDEIIFYPHVSYFVYETLDTLFMEDETNIVRFPPPGKLLQIPQVEYSNATDSIEFTEVNGEFKQTLHNDTGLVYLPTRNLSHEEATTEVYTTNKEVSWAQVDVRKVLQMKFDGLVHDDSDSTEISMKFETDQTMKGAYDVYETTEALRVVVDGKLFWERSWRNVVPRK